MIQIILLAGIAVAALIYIAMQWTALNKVYNNSVGDGETCDSPPLFSIDVSQGEVMLQFKLNLPKKSFHDVVERKLSVMLNGVHYKTLSLDSEARSVEGLECSHNDMVSGELVDIDRAGNSSEPRKFQFVVVDNVAPPMPEEVLLDVTGQSEPAAEEPAAEEPAAEEPVAEEPVAEEPVAEEPVAEEPAAEEPAMYLSPEALEDIRNWGLDQVDEVTRREIYTASEGAAAEEPAAEEPAAEEPAAEEPAAEEDK